MCDAAPNDRLVVNRYRFKGLRNFESWCSLELQRLPDGRTVVIATEVRDNPGTSITNVAEGLALAVCQEYGIDPEQLVWIEHYG